MPNWRWGNVNGINGAASPKVRGVSPKPVLEGDWSWSTPSAPWRTGSIVGSHGPGIRCADTESQAASAAGGLPNALSWPAASGTSSGSSSDSTTRSTAQSYSTGSMQF